MAEIPHFGTERGRLHADFLLTRARRGDRHAFELLLEQYAPMIDNVSRNYLPDGLVDRDDLRQMVAISLWTSVKKVRRVEQFTALASKIAADTLATDYAHRRRLRRWNRAGRDIRLSELENADVELCAPSWALGADPVKVVIYRESMSRAWGALKQHHRDAINQWLARQDDAPHDPDLYARVATARTIALRALDREGDVEAAKDRKCEHCGDWIPATARADAIYCCDAHLRAARDARVRAANRDPERRCQTCDGPIPEELRADAKFCSLDCRREGARRRKRERLAAAAA